MIRSSKGKAGAGAGAGKEERRTSPAGLLDPRLRGLCCRGVSALPRGEFLDDSEV